MEGFDIANVEDIIPEESPNPFEEAIRASRAANPGLLRESTSPRIHITSVEAAGYLLWTLLGAWLLTAVVVFGVCSSSLLVMALFAPHPDRLLNLGLPAAKSATLWLSPFIAVIWKALELYREVKDRT